ncbi:Protein of unknown function [Blastococcus sp. DSM 46786]|uniref:DUF998 domain-containing protein n=1 Tax=Blastococcus sp. DSM 46786 TaxID=1798227 RepID=UPI0008BA8FEA|nr:DUF998 domain-containing protein [Blastococcus sp. DSM 46786]SEL10894.1 Protein of unknown function [Blastococcus sp. DSM 46786]
MATAPTLPRPATSTTGTPDPVRVRRLLCLGALAWPLFLLVGFTQALIRDGFDLQRHPFSMLSLGGLGWIQIATFVATGLAFLAAAAGLRTALRGERGATWGPRLFGLFGIAMLGGGVFVADPSFGFPAGAPSGAPPVISWHGALHGVAFGVGALALIAACFVFARRFAALGRRGWALYSAANGVLLFVPMAAMGTDVGVVVQYVAAVLGWSWTSAVLAHLAKHVH